MTVTYAYDQNGERIKYAHGTTTTIYPTKGYNTTGTAPTKHIFANGQLIADITGTGAGAVAQYVNGDQLTGSNVITNDSGAAKEVLDYYPFGALRLDEQTGFNEQRKFAGHEFDAETGLSYQDARYYSPSIGRFASEDQAFLSLGLNLADPQSLNAYTYTRNNPVINIDPTGNTLQQTVGTFFLNLAVPNEQAQIILGNATQNAYNNNVVVRTALDHPFVAGAVIGVTSAGLSYGALTAAPYAADVISTIGPSTIGRAVTGAGLNVAGKYLEAKAGHENVSAADYAYTAFVGAVAANTRATLVTRVFTAAATDLVGQRFLHPTNIDPQTTALSAATTFGVGEITRLSLFSAAPEFSKFVTEQALSFVFDAAGHVLNAGITNSAKQKGKSAK